MPTTTTKKSKLVLDWFNVSYRSVVLASVLLLAVGAVGLGYWRYVRVSGPSADAEEAIRRAEAKRDESAKVEGGPRIDEARAAAVTTLGEARGAFEESRFDDARVAAIRAENLFQKVLDLAGGSQAGPREVRFYQIEGDVRVKRAGEFNWESADRKMVLAVGDQIKTSSSASVQLIYFDGTMTTVRPGSLLEIREVHEDPATKVRRVSERLNWGEVTASTQKRNVDGSFHEVSTEQVSARSTETGEFRVSLDKESREAAFEVFQGRLDVAASGRRESLGEGERIRSNADGRLLSREVLPGVPRLIAPPDQRVFVHEDPTNSSASLSWEKVPGAVKYQVMIADRPLFTNLLYDAPRTETTVMIEGIKTGAYFWKVAAISASGVVGAFSPPRSFRVTSQKIRDREDTVPPKLEIAESVLTGSMLILNGRTEPGALLWIDGERVDVYEDGAFYAVLRLKKEGTNELELVARDGAGNATRLLHRAFVEAY